MNQAMWSNPATQNNLQQLKTVGVRVFGPASGEQACGDVGLGRLLEPTELLALASAEFMSGALAGLRVVVTAGPTREAIDPVRYLSNHSSGKMGYALAQAASDAGAEVTLVSGPTALAPPDRCRVVAVQSADDMLKACQALEADVFVAVAAVADYRVAAPAEHKLKKTDAALTLTLERTPDILATVAAGRPKPFCVGFAAETRDLDAYARQKLVAKQLDMIVANEAVATFGQDEATVSVFWPGGGTTLPRQSKQQLARALVALIATRLASR